MAASGAHAADRPAPFPAATRACRACRGARWHRPPTRIQPPVEREVVVGWRQVGAVIGGDRILAERVVAGRPPRPRRGRSRRRGQVVVVDAHLAGAGPHVDSTAWRRAAGRSRTRCRSRRRAAGRRPWPAGPVSGHRRRTRGHRPDGSSPRRDPLRPARRRSRRAARRGRPAGWRACRGRRRCRSGCAWSGTPTAPSRPACGPAGPPPGANRAAAGRPLGAVGHRAVRGHGDAQFVAVVDHLLEQNAGPMIRPSNSGMATPSVTSSGDRPAARRPARRSTRWPPRPGAQGHPAGRAANPSPHRGPPPGRRPTAPRRRRPSVVVTTTSASRNRSSTGGGAPSGPCAASSSARPGRWHHGPRWHRRAGRPAACCRPRRWPGRSRPPRWAGPVVGLRPEQAHRREVGGRLEAKALEQDGVGNEA